MKSVLSWVLGCLLLLSLVAYAVGAPPSLGSALSRDIPLAELGQRADQQQAPPLPVIEHGQALIEAPMQALRGRVGPEGLRVESTSATEGKGEFRLVTSWLAAGGPAAALASGTVTLRDSAVMLDRGTVEEVYTTVSEGLRQNIIVNTHPTGPGDLTLTLGVEGATARLAGTAATLTLPSGRKLLYHGLKATDAAGKALETVLSQRGPQTLAITVRGADAIYPITLAATITDEDWFALGSGTSAEVSALAVAPDGTLYAGGTFTKAGEVTVNHIARWDGSAWSALGNGINFGGFIDSGLHALVVAPDGTLYAGGRFRFRAANGYDAENIARWDGSAWSALGSGTDEGVSSLAVAPDGKLYAGGSFSQAGGVTVNHIARWDGSAWSALGSGTSGTVSALAVAPDGKLYAGGYFSQAGGVTVNHIARWDGSAWSALGSGTNPYIYDLAVAPDGTLYAGGYFSQAGGVAVNHIAGIHLVIIPQAPLVLTADPNPAKVYQNIKLSTTGGSGTGAVSYALSSGPCTLDGNTLVGNAYGSCVVTATKAADPNYSSATSSPVTIVVNLWPQDALVLRGNPSTILINGASTLSTTGGSGIGAVSYALSSGPCTLDGNNLIGNAPGSCVVKAIKAADGYYDAVTSAPVTIKVKLPQAPLLLSANPPTVLVNGTSILSTTGGSGSGAVSYALSGGPCTLVGNTLIGNAYGSCMVTATKAEDTKYGAITSAPVTVDVKLPQAALILNANPTSIKVNETSTLITTGGNGTGAVTYALNSGPCSLSGNVLKGTGGGACVVSATKSADAVYDAITSAPVTVTINRLNQAALVLSANPSTIPVNGASTLSTTGGSGSGTVTYALTGGPCSLTSNVLSGISGGTCVVTATKAADAVYNAFTSEPITVTVNRLNQAALVLSASPSTIPVNGASTLSTTGGNGTGAVTYELISGPCSLSGNIIKGIGLGSCMVTATKSADASYLAATAQDAIITVTPPIYPGPHSSLRVQVKGQGDITSTPLGIDCGALCSYAFTKKTTVMLTAVPANGWKFKGWSGACQGKKPSCKVRLNGNKTVKARFKN